MKLKYFILSMAFMLAVVLTGCSAGRENNSTAPVQPTGGMSSDHNDRASAGVDGNAQSSPDFGGAQNSANVDNDAFQGGGAGGTNDQNNDGAPDSSSGIVASDPSNGGSGMGGAVDDIGRAAGDLTRGAGNAARDAGNAISNAANDIGGAMR